MNAGVSGFREEGTWDQVVEHGEAITRALHQAGLKTAATGVDDLETALEEWEVWRPKPHDDVEKDVARKTADQASIKPGPGEKAGRKAGEDLDEAGSKLREAVSDFFRRGIREALSDVSASLSKAGRAADSAGRKVIRSVEDTVYRRVMTPVTPYYFDNELISADLSRKATPKGEPDQYVLEVNISDDRLKNRVARILKKGATPSYEVAGDLPEKPPDDPAGSPAA